MPLKKNPVLALQSYDPANLLDSLQEKLSLKNDAALSKFLKVAPPVISKIRNKKLPVGPGMLIHMHESTDMSIKELRALMGDMREKYESYGGVPSSASV